jgi:hypothetical protein
VKSLPELSAVPRRERPRRRADRARAERVLGGCVAMSRFLVWVWCESYSRAVADDDERNPHARWLGATDNRPRQYALRCALERGLLRLEWRAL